MSNQKSATFFFKHALGVVPRLVEVSFSPTADGARTFPLSWSYPRPEAGNPVTIEARADAVYLHIASGVPLHGVYDGTSDKWTTFTNGYFRIIAVR